MFITFHNKDPIFMGFFGPKLVHSPSVWQRWVEVQNLAVLAEELAT